MAKITPTPGKDLMRTLADVAKQAHPDKDAAKAPDQGRKKAMPHVHEHTHPQAPNAAKIRRTRGVKRGQ